MFFCKARKIKELQTECKLLRDALDAKDKLIQTLKSTINTDNDLIKIITQQSDSYKTHCETLLYRLQEVQEENKTMLEMLSKPPQKPSTELEIVLNDLLVKSRGITSFEN